MTAPQLALSFFVEGCHLVVGLMVSDVSHELGITKGSIYPRQPANELERHRRALVLIVNGGDFELGQIKAFAKHVDTDNDKRKGQEEMHTVVCIPHLQRAEFKYSGDHIRCWLNQPNASRFACAACFT